MGVMNTKIGGWKGGEEGGVKASEVWYYGGVALLLTCPALPPTEDQPVRDDARLPDTPWSAVVLCMEGGSNSGWGGGSLIGAVVTRSRVPGHTPYAVICCSSPHLRMWFCD